MSKQYFPVDTAWVISLLSLVAGLAFLPEQTTLFRLSSESFFFFACTFFIWSYIWLYFESQKRKTEKILNMVGFGKNTVSYINFISRNSIHFNPDTGDILTIDLNDECINRYSFHDWIGCDKDEHIITIKFRNINASAFTLFRNRKSTDFCRKLERFENYKYS
ncbi:hypothetical protein [Escherichia coli]|uniref:hypothetical protein n=1 Tax=Escherichia coli TaxID=562 RepID=UPI000B7EAE53|nr:hypothetical protein [Escherichia coli]